MRMELPHPHVLAAFVAVAGFSAAAEAGSQQYQVTFESLWNSTDHPTNFPAGLPPVGAHFSQLVGLSHNSNIDIWSEGVAASPAVENVAEIGSPGLFLADVSSAITAGDALSQINASLTILPSPGMTDTNIFLVDDAHPFVTLLSMLGPSHDWFVGVDSLDLRDGGGFINSMKIDLFVYDAGTEPGTDFSLAGNEVEGGVIGLLANADTFFGSNLPVARFTFTAVPAPSTIALLSAVAGISLTRRRRPS